jgi:adenosine deaminase
MLRSGCKVTLSTDDPAYFQTSPRSEYILAKSRLGVSNEILHQINNNSIDMAFCDLTTKQRLLERINLSMPAELPPG